ncbi:MAG: hypothetical protein DRP49_04765 [Spirochaetes bacterium]|nr:MAG: hypothetical protein DRP49_04765 [Spirochaetota bacterium]
MTKTTIIIFIILITVFFASCSNPLTPVVDINDELMSEESEESLTKDLNDTKEPVLEETPAVDQAPVAEKTPADKDNKGPGNNNRNDKDNGKHKGRNK